MAGESISQAIFFISSMLIAIVVVVALFSAVSSISESYVMKNGHIEDVMKTDIEVVNDPLADNRDYIYVLNTGSTALNASNVLVFINGKYDSDLDQISIVNDDGDGIWESGEMIQISKEVGDAYQQGDLVMVALPNGVTDTKQL